ncbi:dendrin [Eublepharis macularius]|uniref:Dendrin n=1 Tax=Eublepharis macularius TaxID=481883 RepID=A0AA97J6E5_EUBMA|nr:dendrin [Eublepharis macularius]
MFERPGLKPGDGGRFRVCERTNLLFVEFNTVSCSSRSTMEAGPWTGKGYSAPWMYHRVAGQYTLFEKRLLSDFAPCPRRPGPRVLQDSTNRPAGQPPPGWGPPRQERAGPAANERRGAEASPEPRAPRSPAGPGGCGAEPARGAALAPDGGRAHRGAPARSPPSYEAHLLLRLRAGQGPRKENCPRPPPYVAPPSYEAAHRTVQPRPRAGGPAGAGARPARAPEPDGGARAPGGGSFLLGARTWAGRRRQAERAEPPRPRSPQPRSHTLPRASRRPPGGPPHALPAGWAFSPSAGPKAGVPGGRRRGARAAGPGGVLEIDATCVVIRTRYVPPARAERVRPLGRPGPARSPAAASLQERAARILGLPASELGFAGPAGRRSAAASPRRPRGPAESPGPAPSPAAGSPGSPVPSPAAPAEPGPSGPPAGSGGAAGPSGGSYARALREAMARIRRHTAPDSDTDEELERGRRAGGGQGRRGGGRLARGSSSSSLESSASAATVVPGGAPSSGGPAGWQPRRSGEEG